MAEVLMYSQGQTATLTADFVTVSGNSVDVPDASIRIIGAGGAEILASTPMIKLPNATGFYYYDWSIPNSLPPYTYTAVVGGTVDDMSTSMSTYLQVVLAGTPTVSGTTQREVGMIDALNTYIQPANRVPIYNELARRNQVCDKYRFNWPRWNLGNPEIRRNGEIIIDGYQLDMDAGVVTFDRPQHPSDEVEASYNFRMFSTNDMRRFISDALNQINLQAPGTNYSIETVPDNWVGVIMLGASKNAFKQLMAQLTFQEPRTIYGTDERAKEAIDTYRTLKENNEKEFEAEKKAVKISRYPRTAAIVAPEFTLPGGRCLSRYTSSIYEIEDKLVSMSIEEAFEQMEIGIKLKVLAFDEDKKESVFAEVHKIWCSGSKKCMKITTENGKCIIATPEHLFLVGEEYIPCSSLSIGTELLTYRNNDFVKSKISHLTEEIDGVRTYDMEVPETHNFIADGIVCHNSRWFRNMFSGSGT